MDDGAHKSVPAAAAPGDLTELDADPDDFGSIIAQMQAKSRALREKITSDLNARNAVLASTADALRSELSDLRAQSDALARQLGFESVAEAHSALGEGWTLAAERAGFEQALGKERAQSERVQREVEELRREVEELKRGKEYKGKKEERAKPSPLSPISPNHARPRSSPHPTPSTFSLKRQLARLQAKYDTLHASHARVFAAQRRDAAEWLDFQAWWSAKLERRGKGKEKGKGERGRKRKKPRLVRVLNGEEGGTLFEPEGEREKPLTSSATTAVADGPPQAMDIDPAPAPASGPPSPPPKPKPSPASSATQSTQDGGQERLDLRKSAIVRSAPPRTIRTPADVKRSPPAASGADPNPTPDDFEILFSPHAQAKTPQGKEGEHSRSAGKTPKGKEREEVGSARKSGGTKTQSSAGGVTAYGSEGARKTNMRSARAGDDSGSSRKERASTPLKRSAALADLSPDVNRTGPSRLPSCSDVIGSSRKKARGEARETPGSKRPRVEDGGRATPIREDGSGGEGQFETPTGPLEGLEWERYLRSVRRKGIAELEKDPYKYKGRGRYATSIPRPEDEGLNRLYPIDPKTNDGLPFAYDAVVRKRDERAALHGGDCECCREYYEVVKPVPRPQGPIWQDEDADDNERSPTRDAAVESARQAERRRKREMEMHKNDTSRHRAKWDRAKTPPGYWEVGFPSTQKVAAMNREAAMMEEEKRARRAAEAAKQAARNSASASKRR